MAVFVPPPVTRKADHTTGTWPVGTLIYDTTAHTLWVGDGSMGGQVVTVAASDLPAFTNTTQGAVPVPSPAGGTTKFLREDASWQVPAYPPTFSNTVSGLVPIPSPAAGSAKYLREDATWVVPPTGGGGSMEIGSAVGSGTANRVLFEDGSAKLADSANFTYSSGTLTVASGHISCTNAASATSEQFGAGATSTGAFASLAIGSSANAALAGAVAIGPQASALGYSSIAIGYLTTSSANNTVVVGGSSSAGSNCVAFGSFCVVSGDYSVGVGAGTTASGIYSVAVGSGETKATGTGSIAIGTTCSSLHGSSVAIGFNAVTTTTNQLMLGNGPNNTRIEEIVFGQATPHINFEGINASSHWMLQAQVTSDWADSTEINRKGRLYLKAIDVNGTREGIRVEADGSGPRLGFFGANAVVQQTGGSLSATGSYTSNEQTMINAIWTALRNLGLIT